MSALATSRKLVAVVSTCVALAGLVRTAAAETAAQEQTAADEWINIPAGIADAANKTAYVTNSSDCLEALDLTNGHTLWENKQVQRALALTGQRLVAVERRGTQQPANTMGLAILDAGNGHVLTNSQQIVLPEWIAVEGGIGLGFTSFATMDGNTLNLYWHAWRQLVGAAPSAAAIAAAKKDETGVARVDLESGRVEVHEEPIPKQTRANKGHFTDVGDIRLIVSERQEKVTGGVQLTRRILEASDKRTGRPLWRHEIASDLIVPNNLPEQAARQMMQSEMRR